MSKQSLKVNAILNATKTILSIIFPLITFPYASRVLQVENLGKVNFSGSIVSYFLLISGLGISTYAIREGSFFREDKKKFNEFANQVFTINLISTVIAYIALFICIIKIELLHDYKELLILQSSIILFTTLGVDWIFSIYEDYFYITIRSLIFQFISMIFLFLFVKKPEDYYIYAMITIFSTVGSNIYNYIYSRKYCKITFTRKLNLKKHLKPILIIFSTSIATTLYVNSDLTILGIMSGDYAVGLYSASSKIYTVLKSLLSAVIVSTLPRLSFYISNSKKEKYQSVVNKIFNGLSIIIIPTFVGINVLANEIILLLSGKGYIEATSSLRILSIALVFSTLGSFVTTSILLPMKMEKFILQATLVGAISNVGLNLFFIPYMGQDGAALTTVIAELLVFSISYHYGKKHMDFEDVLKNIGMSLIGCTAIVLISLVLKQIVFNDIIYSGLVVILGALAYLLVLILSKNKLALEMIKEIKIKIKK